MKKVIGLVLAVMLVAGSAGAVEITLEIDDSKVSRVIAAMKGLYEIPTDEFGIPLFNDNQWAKEAVRRWIIFSVRRYEAQQASQAAAQAVTADDEMVR